MFKRNYETRHGNWVYSRQNDIKYSRVLENYEPTFLYRISDYDINTLVEMYDSFAKSYLYFETKVNCCNIVMINFFYTPHKDCIVILKIKLLLTCLILELQKRISDYQQENASLYIDYYTEQVELNDCTNLEKYKNIKFFEELETRIERFIENNSISRDLKSALSNYWYNARFYTNASGDCYDNITL